MEKPNGAVALATKDASLAKSTLLKSCPVPTREVMTVILLDLSHLSTDVARLGSRATPLVQPPLCGTSLLLPGGLSMLRHEAALKTLPTRIHKSLYLFTLLALPVAFVAFSPVWTITGHGVAGGTESSSG